MCLDCGIVVLIAVANMWKHDLDTGKLHCVHVCMLMCTRPLHYSFALPKTNTAYFLGSAAGGMLALPPSSVRRGCASPPSGAALQGCRLSMTCHHPASNNARSLPINMFTCSQLDHMLKAR